jgi:hypothetical protein
MVLGTVLATIGKESSVAAPSFDVEDRIFDALALLDAKGVVADLGVVVS